MLCWLISLAVAAQPGLRTVPITDVPLGARVLAGNPRPEELDLAWPEPEQAKWVTLSLDLVKRDGTPVKAEFLRPREWVERNGIVAGAALPIAISELEVEGNAFVTGITPCPPVAEGPGRVVTGRFVTRDAGNLVRVTLENGTAIQATDVHPIWTVDREEWIPAGELVPGQYVDTLTGPVAVESVERLHSGHDVYNIEVHGEHVFRVTADGVLVHNACANYRKTFFAVHPSLEGQVVVHHAIEPIVLTKYPGVLTDAEMHAIDNLRGIPLTINSDIHLSRIRLEWNKFYRTFDMTGLVPTRQQLLQKAAEIDAMFGSFFTPRT